MGFGVSGATAIVFLGLFIAAGTLYTTTAATYEEVTEAQDGDHERLLDRRNTAINVSNVTAVNGTLTLEVENTGSTTLSVNDTTVLVDNDYYSTADATVDGVTATDLWEPGETLELTVSVSSPLRVKVVTENGVAETVGV